jgi:toxin ParE1/3/4
MPQYRLSDQASRDIERLYEDGLVSFGLAEADRYYAGLLATFDFLVRYPRAARLRAEIDPPARAYRYRSHLIVYELDHEDAVVVLRVRHGREDWQADVSSN